jgi:hypothetical protein
LEQCHNVIIQQKNIVAFAEQNFKNIMGMDPVAAIGLGNPVGGMAIYIKFLMFKGGFQPDIRKIKLFHICNIFPYYTINPAEVNKNDKFHFQKMKILHFFKL